MSDDRLTTRDIARSMETATANPPSHAQRRPHETDARSRCSPATKPSGFRTRWEAVQTGFVDEPRKAVEEADALVAQVIKRLSEVFADERTTSSISGIRTIRSRPRIFESRCGSIVRSSIGCCLSRGLFSAETNGGSAFDVRTPGKTRRYESCQRSTGEQRNNLTDPSIVDERLMKRGPNRRTNSMARRTRTVR